MNKINLKVEFQKILNTKKYFLKYKNFLSIDCDFPRIYEDEINQNPIIQKSLPKKLPSMNIFTIGVVLALTLSA